MWVCAVVTLVGRDSLEAKHHSALEGIFDQVQVLVRTHGSLSVFWIWFPGDC